VASREEAINVRGSFLDERRILWFKAAKMVGTYSQGSKDTHVESIHIRQQMNFTVQRVFDVLSSNLSKSYVT
jgi:hypothetical protein